MQDQSNQTNPQPTPEDTAQNVSAPASQEVGKGQQESGWKQKIQALLKKCTILLAIVGALFLIVGVPIVINELYKRPGYVTMWSAADMLGYYGTLLGAFVGIVTLVMTIWFTRCQIQREGYLQTEKEKWERIEATCNEYIKILDPMEILDNIEMVDVADTQSKINFLLDYLIVCRKTRRFCINYLNQADYTKIQCLKEKMDKCFELCVFGVCCGVSTYDEFRRYCNKENNFDSSFVSNEIWRRLQEFEDSLKWTNKHIYIPLLEYKNEVFIQIYTDIQKEADNILSPWRKH